MKIQTGFDKTLKEVYHMLALPYPPCSIKNEEQPEIEDEDEVELEETAILVKPFKPKFKSYNINKDSLTSHRAAKQLTGLISELERKRRENESNKEVHNNTNYLEYKENVVNLINHLSSRAKAEKAQNDSLEEGQLKEKKKVLLSDLRRFSNALRADKQEETEQARRVIECQDNSGRRATIDMVAQLTPIHEQLTYFFQGENACANTVVRAASSGDFESLYSSDSREKVLETRDKMNHILDSVELSEENDIPRPLEGTLLKGAGKIGRSCKKGSDAFKSNMENIAENNRKKSIVHSELMVSMARNTGEKERKVAAEERKCKDRMSVVLDTMVHKVKGKEVEKLRDEERKNDEFDRARVDTIDKINDYGKRKEVLDNADTTYLTDTKHDAKTAQAKRTSIDVIANTDRKKVLHKTTGPARIPANKSAGRVVKERRPTGAVIPPGKFIKPVVKGTGSPSTVRGTLQQQGGKVPARKPSQPQAPVTGPRKPSGASPSTLRKPSAGPAGKVSPSTLRKPSAGPAGKVSPSTLRKPSAGPAGKVSPSTLRKPSAGPAGKVSPSTVRKPSAGPAGSRKPSASKPTQGSTSKWN
ncbi:uncharacterized protein LOC134811769 isoform X2 [Bolinopsis microptera]|uniref:uncharacterized protein LOC134811769 isoform X2 n=1 Tax=Bolinopsis microptera TaxID=2820187 RepID=UPI003079EBE3